MAFVWLPQVDGALSIPRDWPEVIGRAFQTGAERAAQPCPAFQVEFVVPWRDQPGENMPPPNWPNRSGPTGWFAFIAMGCRAHFLGGGSITCCSCSPCCAGRRPWQTVTIVTGFTVAHRGHHAQAWRCWRGHVPSRIVEPAESPPPSSGFAVENLVARRARPRWLIAMILGLIHGPGLSPRALTQLTSAARPWCGA